MRVARMRPVSQGLLLVKFLCFILTSTIIYYFIREHFAQKCAGNSCFDGSKTNITFESAQNASTATHKPEPTLHSNTVTETKTSSSVVTGITSLGELTTTAVAKVSSFQSTTIPSEETKTIELTKQVFLTTTAAATTSNLKPSEATSAEAESKLKSKPGSMSTDAIDIVVTTEQLPTSAVSFDLETQATKVITMDVTLSSLKPSMATSAEAESSTDAVDIVVTTEQLPTSAASAVVTVPKIKTDAIERSTKAEEKVVTELVSIAAKVTKASFRAASAKPRKTVTKATKAIKMTTVDDYILWENDNSRLIGDQEIIRKQQDAPETNQTQNS